MHYRDERIFLPWINGKTSVENMKKKNPLIHVKGDPYLHAANLEKLGVDTYNQEVLER